MQELAAITGGAGFIGSHLAEGFVRQGYAVRIIDNLTTGSIGNLASIRGEVDFRKIDLRDLDGLTEAFRGVSIVLHHGGISSVPLSFEDPVYIHEVNVTGTFNVFAAAIRARVRRVVNASSSSVYGNNGAELQTESAVPSPLSPYGISKWMGELYAAQFARLGAIETISLRYFNVFGPRQNLERGYGAVIPLFIRKLADGNRPVIFGDGTQTRDFTFIDNIVEANLRAVKVSLPEGTILNVATGARISLNELASVLNEIFGSQIRSINEPERPGDIKHSCADTRLSEKFLGDYKVAAFREGLVKTARWFLEVSGHTKRCAEP
jgi:UDP-N-acetylglucosamine/UDP-N-acetyl-alpha-D-glucosaminouronate 4-epimerase